jgi:DNA-binding MarR family transcriptional regulator
MERKPNPHDLLVALLQTQSAVERLSDAFFQPFGLTSAQFNILNLLSVNSGRMEQLALVDALLVGKSSISIVINRMVRADLLRREAHPRDRRQVILVLTPKGRGLWKKIAPTYEAGVQEVFGTITPARRQPFLLELTTLREALNRRLADL